MTHELPALPYERDALAPVNSAETPDYCYGKHHQAYMNNQNNLLAGGEFGQASRIRFEQSVADAKQVCSSLSCTARSIRSSIGHR